MSPTATVEIEVKSYCARPKTAAMRIEDLKHVIQTCNDPAEQALAQIRLNRLLLRESERERREREQAAAPRRGRPVGTLDRRSEGLSDPIARLSHARQCAAEQLREYMAGAGVRRGGEHMEAVDRSRSHTDLTPPERFANLALRGRIAVERFEAAIDDEQCRAVCIRVLRNGQSIRHVLAATGLPTSGHQRSLVSNALRAGLDAAGAYLGVR